MTDASRTDDPSLPAGSFSAWLDEAGRAIAGTSDADVPCDTCTACCTSSQFVHIGPDETDTLARIPKALLFPAPLLPRGHVLLGYDGRGHCPMLVDGGCSIYEHRPRTCRSYDCRVFPAAGLTLDDDESKGGIAERARRWEFGYPTDADRVEQEAVGAAAAFLHGRRDELPGIVPTSTTQLAVLAIEVHRLFLGREGDGRATVVDPSPEVVGAELVRRRDASQAKAEAKRPPRRQAARRPRR